MQKLFGRGKNIYQKEGSFILFFFKKKDRQHVEINWCLFLNINDQVTSHWSKPFFECISHSTFCRKLEFVFFLFYVVGESISLFKDICSDFIITSSSTMSGFRTVVISIGLTLDKDGFLFVSEHVTHRGVFMLCP